MFESNRRVRAADEFPELAAAVAAVPVDVGGGGSAASLGAEILALTELERQVQARKLARIARFQEQGMATAWGCASTSGFVRAFTRVGGGQAAALVDGAMVLQAMPALAARLDEGSVGLEHVRAVTRSTAHVAREVLTEADAVFADAAASAHPRDLAALGDTLTECYRADKVAESRQAAEDLRYLKVERTFAGMWSVDAMLTPEQGATLVTALTPLTKPAGEEDIRTTDQRRADAFVGLVELGLRSAALPDCGGDRPRLTLVVTQGRPNPWLAGAGRWSTSPAASAVRPSDVASVRALVGELAGTAVEVSRDAIERIHCDADVNVLTTDPDGEPLNHGRSRRDASPTQRRAMVVRDGGCVFPGCRRPPSWCQAHHLRWWLRDEGPTDMDNLALVCSFHHHLLHEGGWLLERIVHGDQDRPPDFLGQAWRAVSPDGLVLREFRQPAA